MRKLIVAVLVVAAMFTSSPAEAYRCICRRQCMGTVADGI